MIYLNCSSHSKTIRSLWCVLLQAMALVYALTLLDKYNTFVFNDTSCMPINIVQFSSSSKNLPHFYIVFAKTLRESDASPACLAVRILMVLEKHNI